MQKFKVFLLIFIVPIFSSCIGRNTGDSKSNNCDAHFIVEEVTNAELRISDEKALPETFTITLKTCMHPQALPTGEIPHLFWFLSLKDPKNLSNFPKELPLKDQDIKNPSYVSGTLDSSSSDKENKQQNCQQECQKEKGDKKNQCQQECQNPQFIYLQADEKGCVEWSETYDYPYVKKSQWIVMNRYITGNQYSGSCEIPVAVNPWLQNKEEYQDIQVVDYREEYRSKHPDIAKNLVKIRKCDKDKKKDEEQNCLSADKIMHSPEEDHKKNTYKIAEDCQLENKNCLIADGLGFLKYAKDEENKYKVDLIVDKVDFRRSFTDSKESKASLNNITIEAAIQYRIKDIDGTRQPNLIKQGKFTITPHLLSLDSDCVPAVNGLQSDSKCADPNKIRILKYSPISKLLEEPGTVKEESGTVQADFENNMLKSKPFTWSVPLINNESSLWLYLKIEPNKTDIDTANRINPFEGIYKLNDKFTSLNEETKISAELDSLFVNKYREKFDDSNKDHKKMEVSFKQIYNDPNQCLKDWKIDPSKSLFDTPCISSDEDLKTSDGYSNSGWTIAKMSLRFSGMQKENWLFRSINTIVETSLLNSSNKTVGDKKMSIEVIDLSTGRTELINDKFTEKNGNISFTIPTWQYWYKRQRYFLKIIHFRTNTKDLDETKIVAINPWDYGFTHGFEVKQPDDIISTCMDKGNHGSQEKSSPFDRLLTSLNGLFKREPKEPSDKELQDTIQSSTEHQDLIKQFFCYGQGYSPIKSSISTYKADSERTLYFAHFVTILNKAYKYAKNLTDIFRDKFKTVKEKLNPVSYVHLFRSVTKYPTYLIDHSLGRSIYYNTRLKLSPRVVRYDDIARGQQNKGPLRDGIYNLRLMIVKNDQGRFNGRGAMASVLLNDFSYSAFVQQQETAGRNNLYQCSIDKDQDCITLEDFIMPPTNIPVVIRDGMVKTDVPIYINRNNLLFANSKNILVFQLVPADPKSVICKGDNTTCAVGGWQINSKYKSWEEAIDWEQTIKTIKPAEPESYDMYFHTYQTPIIPSEWTNWNITHELNKSFNDISNQFYKLSNKNSLESRKSGFEEQEKYSDEEYTKCTDDPYCNKYVFKPKGWFKKALNYYSNKIRNTISAFPTQTNHIVNTENPINTLIAETKTQIKDDNTLSDEEKSAILDQVDKYISEEKIEKIIEKITGDLNTRNISLTAHLDKLKEDEKISATSTEEIKILEVEIRDIEEKLKMIEENPLQALSMFIPTTYLRQTREALTNRLSRLDTLQKEKYISADRAEEAIEAIKVEIEDIDKQIKNYREGESIEKALSKEGDRGSRATSWVPDSCAGSTQERDRKSYLKDAGTGKCSDLANTTANKDQPAVVASEAEDIDMSYEHIEKFATQHGLCTIGINSSLPKQCGTEAGDISQQFIQDLNHQIGIINELKDQKGAKTDKKISMADSFLKELSARWEQKDKLEKMPKLSSLSATAIANVIKEMDPRKNPDMGIDDNAIGSFLHGLCGFWFKDFISHKYTSLSLLEDVLRRFIKEEVHYQTRIFTSPLSKIKGEKPPENELDPTYVNHILEELQKIKPNPEDSQEDSQKKLSQAIELLLEKLVVELQMEQEKKSATGYIDYSHRWADGEENTTEQLADNLKALLEKTAFSDKIISTFNEKKILEEGISFALVDWILDKNPFAGSPLDRYKHPFMKCISNPTYFFSLEKKVVVGKVGEGVAYDREGGHITRLDVTESFLMNTQRDQGSNQGFSYGLGTGELALLSSSALITYANMRTNALNQRTDMDNNANLKKSKSFKGKGLISWIGRHPLLSIPLGIFTIGSLLKINMGYDWRVYGGTGKRRWLSIGVVEGTELVSEYTPIHIPLEKYHECLVIRPRFNAFERHTDKYEHIWNTKNTVIRDLYSKTGLMLCAEGDDKNYTIKEDYYYIQPAYAVGTPNRATIDSRSHRNKPFAISLRGREAYHRFKDSISCVVSETSQPVKDNRDNAKCRDTRGEYEHLFSKSIEFAHNLREAFEVPKLFHRTGDFPGIYTPYVPPKDRDIKANLNWYYRFINWMASGVPLKNAYLEKIIHKEPEKE